MKRTLGSLLSIKVVFSLYFVLAVSASMQSYYSGNKLFISEEKREYTSYNNYVIFEESFQHLINHQDLYVHYPDEHWDLYKYTPTFSVFFGFFSIFPDWLGLTLWNLVNVLFFFFAVWLLPRFTDKQKVLILLICMIELITSVQNEQSNGLMAGLMILGFAFMERNRYWLAAFFMVFSVFIKLFGIVGFTLFIFYPKKWKIIVANATWAIVLFLIPLFVIDFQQYGLLLNSFLTMLSNDHSISYGLSVMGWLYSWFGLDLNKMCVLLAGIILFLLPLVRYRMYNDINFRYLYLASTLIWVVIFNHKAESPTFIIAMAGVAIGFFTDIPYRRIYLAMLIFSILFTSLSPTDLFPPFVRNDFFIPYTIKVVPCIFVWSIITYILYNFPYFQLKTKMKTPIEKTKFNK